MVAAAEAVVDRPPDAICGSCPALGVRTSHCTTEQDDLVDLADLAIREFQKGEVDNTAAKRMACECYRGLRGVSDGISKFSACRSGVGHGHMPGVAGEQVA